MQKPIEKRYEFVLLFDVENGNPNGDPDADNMPRIDSETGVGLVTDVCIKRRIRNYIDLIQEDIPGYDIYIKDGNILNDENRKAYQSCDIKPEHGADRDQVRALTEYMCDKYYDIRTFGAVMNTAVNCGQVRGPVQLSFGKSVEPVMPQEIRITRLAVTNEKDAGKIGTMGKKFILPYALFRVDGYISAAFAAKTGFGEDDLELLWDALENMFEIDRSASRGKMATRKLFVFEHSSKLGNTHADSLFKRISINKISASKPARSFDDYKIEIDENDFPEGVRLIKKY